MSNNNYILDDNQPKNYMVESNVTPQQTPQPVYDSENGMCVAEYLERYNVTKKAEFLYKNGFCGEPQQVPSIDSTFRDVTHKDGFKGFNVYMGADNNIYIAKAEAEEGNIYSYAITFIKNISDEEFNSLLKIEQETKKFNVVSIFKWVTLIISLVGFALTILSIVTDVVAGSGFVIALIASSLTLLFSGMLAGISGLLFKK